MNDAEKTEPAEGAAGAAAYPRAKVGQDDTGHVVTGAADEPLSGTVADITDGDAHHKKHK